MLSRAVLISFLSSMVTAGCMWAPGNALDTSAMQRTNVARPEGETYSVKYITPEIVLQQKSEARQVEKEAETGLQILTANPSTFRYHIQAQDILSIVVWDHPELLSASGSAIGSTIGAPNNSATGSNAMPYVETAAGGNEADPLGYTVSDDGTIFCPYAGTVHVAGDSLE